MSTMASAMNLTSPFIWFDGTKGGATLDAIQIANSVQEIIAHFSGSATGNQRIDEPAQTIREIYASSKSENWNGDGAKPISKEAAEEAIKLLPALPWDLPIPDIFPDPTGAISFEWYRRPGYRFAMSIYGNRNVEFTGLFGVGDGIYGEARIRNGLPKIIRNALGELFSD